MSLFSCNTGTLAAFVPTAQNPWDASKVKHLYRRLGYGISNSQIASVLENSPLDVVDTLLSEAMASPMTPAPEWAFWSETDYNAPNDDALDELKQEKVKEGYAIVTNDLLTKGLRGRLTFFWLNHFVTKYGEYNCPSYMFQYYNILQNYALGNFKDFVHDIGLTPAMLAFLNNFENTKRRPNENYARELFELFTLGENNGYTQQDIEEASRAMTGYNSVNDKCGAVLFNEEDTFDAGTKTIFGKPGTYDYQGLIDLLFEERKERIAPYICEKLYTYFVNPEADEAIISQMAETFIANSFEIEPVLRVLFRSEHFFDLNTTGIIIKSPYDVTIQFLKETAFTFDDKLIEGLQYGNAVLGQNFFDPVDVAGWQRNRKWLNTNTLAGRWFVLENLIYQTWGEDGANKEQYRTFAKELTNNSKDPAFIAKTMIDFFMSKELASPSEYVIATDILKGEVPANFYTDGIWDLDFDSAPWQLVTLLLHIVKMPEFQLK